MIFEDLARMGISFPVMVPGKPMTSVKLSGYQGKVIMIPAASAKTLNPDAQVQKSTALADWVMQFKDVLPLDVMKIVTTVFEHYDTRLTTGWLADGQARVSVDQMIQQLQKNVQLIAQGGKDLLGRENNIEKLVNQIVASLKKSGLQIE
jgi:delta-aminolevulinic acid dehydratase/porphobilinogen synthase